MNTTDESTLVFERVFKAPRELVWECMTTPEHLAEFWGPVGMSTPVENITVDLRVGGEFTTIMVNDETGEEYPSRGVYTIVDPPNTLGWGFSLDEDSMTSTIEFVDLGDGTTKTVTTQRNVPEVFRLPENQAGMQTALDKGVAYVEKLAAGRAA